MTTRWGAVLLIAVTACGGSPQDVGRTMLIDAVRDAEDLVAGHVFTELMSDDRLAEATRAVCALHAGLGDEEATRQSDSLLRARDWNAPANPAMLDRMLEVGRGLGPDADAELREYQQAYGWTAEADAEMLDLLVEFANAACITVGA